MSGKKNFEKLLLEAKKFLSQFLPEKHGELTADNICEVKAADAEENSDITGGDSGSEAEQSEE